jgi:hypothetical protein
MVIIDITTRGVPLLIEKEHLRGNIIYQILTDSSRSGYMCVLLDWPDEEVNKFTKDLNDINTNLSVYSQISLIDSEKRYYSFWWNKRA